MRGKTAKAARSERSSQRYAGKALDVCFRCGALEHDLQWETAKAGVGSTSRGTGRTTRVLVCSKCRKA